MDLFSYGPGVFLEALLSLPLFSLLVGALVAGVVAVRTRDSVTAVPDRYVRELRVAGAVALGVIVLFAIENIVRGYLLRLVDVVDWWRYPTPILAAAVGLAVLAALIAGRGSAPAEEPVIPTGRRGWATFGRRAPLVAAALAVGALIATSVGAGLASSSDEDGRFIYLELAAPNTELEPLRPWFFGWSYGVPVILSALLLAAVAWTVLRANAVRPYLRPDTVLAEQDARSRVATATARITAAAALLSLAGAFRFIERSGTISGVTVGDGPSYELVWRYAALATAAGWLAPLLEIVAFALLLLVAARALTRRTVAPAVEKVAR